MGIKDQLITMWCPQFKVGLQTPYASQIYLHRVLVTGVMNQLSYLGGIALKDTVDFTIGIENISEKSGGVFMDFLCRIWQGQNMGCFMLIRTMPWRHGTPNMPWESMACYGYDNGLMTIPQQRYTIKLLILAQKQNIWEM